jgi:ABC-type transport system involved in multi-copper enzyme maturation permease subunit
MTFLPIVERELRVASRRRSTYFGRLAGALVAMVLGGWMLLAMSSQSPGQLGQALFISLSVMLFIYSLAAGARITADCLSEEKREGTLGLLFLTDLKGYDIVFGKLAANSVNTFYGLLAAFPVLAISLLMGGVTSGEFWRVALVATNLLFFSLAVGMFASSVCRDERKSMAMAVGISLFILGATPLIELCLNIADNNRANTTAWLIPSPAFACFSAFGPRVGFKLTDFWATVLMTHGYAWIFLILASSIVPRSWQDKTVANPMQFRGLWRLVFKTNVKTENARRTRLLEINPFLWLAARDPIKTTFLWAVIFILSALWIWLASTWPKEWLSIPSYIFAAVLLHTVLKFWLASEACYRFVQDRKSGALELLLSTPLSVGEILQGQRLALFRQFAGPAIYILAVDFIFLFLGLKERNLNQSDERSFWIMLWLVGITVFVMDLFALGWVSMWVGLSSKQANRAANAAIARILILPWMAFFFLMTLLGTASVFSSFRMDEHVVLLFWFGLAVVNNLFFMNWAKRNLRERLRDMARQRFAPKASRFGWLKRRDSKMNQDLPPVIH